MSSETKVCSLCKCVNNSSSVYCKRCKRKLDSNTNTKIIAIPDNEVITSKKAVPKEGSYAEHMPPRPIPAKSAPPRSVPVKPVPPKVVPSKSVVPRPVSTRPVELVGTDKPKSPVSHSTPSKPHNEYFKKAPSLD